MVSKSKRILVCIDKFKDTMKAQVASSLIEQTLLNEAQETNLDITVTKVPISDGGEGFLECI
jgi:glycerate kinase